LVWSPRSQAGLNPAAEVEKSSFPFNAAKVLVGRACGELGDGSEAELSLAAAAAVFEQLGAGPELGQIKLAEAAPRDSA